MADPVIRELGKVDQEILMTKPAQRTAWRKHSNGTENAPRVTQRAESHGEPPWYPTRLLDLGPHGTEADSIKLCITAQDAPEGPYFTLSHCWGNTRSARCLYPISITSERDSLEYPTTYICPSSRSYRCFGVRYLWIDSLCIIQDSVGMEDWLKEGQQMQRSTAVASSTLRDSISRQPGSLFRERLLEVSHPKFLRGTWQATISLHRRRSGIDFPS